MVVYRESLLSKSSVKVPRVQGDTYIDMGANNGGSCSTSGGGGAGSGPSGSATTTSRPEPPATTSPAWTSASVVDCSVKDGLFPDPGNCRGFIKCAQVRIVRDYCLLRPAPCVRVSLIPRSVEEVYTLTRSPTTATGPQPLTVMADLCEPDTIYRYNIFK